MLLTGMPLSPYCLKGKGEAKMSPLLLNWVRSILVGIGFPLSRSSSGFGSNESTCETPPDMYRKMTCFARARGAPRAAPGSSVEPRRPFRAIAPKPVETCASIRLRLIREQSGWLIADYMNSFRLNMACASRCQGSPPAALCSSRSASDSSRAMRAQVLR